MKKRGVLSGFRKTSSSSPTHEQNDLSVDGESHSSSADLSEKSRGMLSTFFRPSPKPAQNYAHCQGTGSSDNTEKKDRADEIPRVPPRPSEEELRNTITHRLSVNPADTAHSQGAGSSDITEKKSRADETLRVPPRPSEEELRNTITHRLSVNPIDADHNQDDLSVDGQSHSSSADLSEKSGGVPSGFFRHSPKPAQSCAHGQVAAVKAWQSISREETQNLSFENMGSRLQAVIDCKGFSSKY
ncbi:hypothetical protein PDJAM_G00204880 [Pangasius djambal]|uniref:Uncharacterized protein n=1 Tax=Pangasius djambal TaxID=1691987 RepID=A0ACC5Y938_9TELE|nr:hypothetical protein [Pangasius djambal]